MRNAWHNHFLEGIGARTASKCNPDNWGSATLTFGWEVHEHGKCARPQRCRLQGQHCDGRPALHYAAELAHVTLWARAGGMGGEQSRKEGDGESKVGSGRIGMKRPALHHAWKLPM